MPPRLLVTLFVLLVSTLNPMWAESSPAVPTPAERDVLRLHTSLPRKQSDALFSYTVEWQQDGQAAYHVTGLSFLNAQKLAGDDADLRVTKKIATALKDAMVQLDPNWRGINVSQPENQAVLKIANKSGYALNTLVFRDYSNQPLGFDLQTQSFSQAGVSVAIDLVYAADVEYLDKFSAHKTQSASQGLIEIGIDQQKPIQIPTDGKTTRELEQAITQAIAQARLSETPLFAHIVNKDTRNNKPFDGSEVQLAQLNAKTLRIDVTDPSLGVLVKFKYPDAAAVIPATEPRSLLMIIGALLALAGAYVWSRKGKKGL